MATKKAKAERTGTVQAPPVPDFATWLERQWRGKEQPQSIDAYPLWKGRDRETRCYHYDIKSDEKVGAKRAAELATEIWSDCQLHCDNLRSSPELRSKGEKTYEVSVIDSGRGGLASPVGTFLLTLRPRVHRPAPTEASEREEQDEEFSLDPRKIMLESVKLVHERERTERENEGKIVGDVMILLKESLKDREIAFKELLAQNLETNKEFSKTLRELAQRSVELRAVGIDEKNAEEDRADRRAARERDNIWTDTMRAGMLEGIKVLSGLIPGFGQLFLAHMTGKPLPEPVTEVGGSQQQVAPSTDKPQLPAVPEEKVIVDRFIQAAESHRIDATHTSGERLFGKDDDSGKPLEPGVFTREQVAILSGVHKGTVGVDALDALLPDSGKPEAVNGPQMIRALPYLTGDMIKDLNKFMELRKEARAKKK